MIKLLSIIHNGIILDLVCGFCGSVGEDVHADFRSSRPEIVLFIFLRPGVRSDDSAGEVMTRERVPPRRMDPMGGSLVLAGVQIREMSCLYAPERRTGV